jgi:hypothetical protein
MAIYEYRCVNESCEKFEDKVSVNKPMMESSRREICSSCLKTMDRVYSAFSVKTADGFKK